MRICYMVDVYLNVLLHYVSSVTTDLTKSLIIKIIIVASIVFFIDEWLH